MRSEFDEWYEKWTGSKVKCENTDIIGAWQHQQTKVDEARAKAQMCRDEKTHAINRWSAVCKERDELQKRLDAAIYLLPSIKAENDLWGCDQVERQIELIEQALKGGSNA